MTILYTNAPTVGAMKTAINGITGFDATGNSIYNSLKPPFLLSSAFIPVPYDATIYPGLRPCAAFYETISDQQLMDRSNFDSTRITDLINRNSQLTARYSSVKSLLESEGILMASDGQPGDLYAWANNRFNRRQGCEARLSQINQQIASNKSALKINNNFFN